MSATRRTWAGRSGLVCMAAGLWDYASSPFRSVAMLICRLAFRPMATNASAASGTCAAQVPGGHGRRRQGIATSRSSRTAAPTPCSPRTPVPALAHVRQVADNLANALPCYRPSAVSTYCRASARRPPRPHIPPHPDGLARPAP